MRGGKVKKSDKLDIENDIKSQLDKLSKFGKFYDDLVNEYIYLIDVREKLKSDIKKKGVRYTFVNGNGIEQEKPNESIANLIKIEQIMLKIINDLDINQPMIKPPSDNTKQLNSGEEEHDLL